MNDTKNNPKDPGAEQSDDDYLSLLAQSILSRERKPRPESGDNNEKPSGIVRTFASSQSSTRVDATPQTPSGVPRPKRNDISLPRIETDMEVKRHASGSHRDWVREVEFYDDQGNYIPGTILLFDDGAVAVFKETNPQKDYDIVYMLRPSGKVVPQGMPLYNYEVEPIGRISASCMDQISSSNMWERDMLVFHLLKYKDRHHIPQIDREHISGVHSTETFSQWAVKKMTPEETPRDQPTVPADTRPKLTRGRRFSINFGGKQRWNAVYWGKDELGHVIAHNTHDHWSLMHLDLDRFKDSIQFDDIVDDDTMRQIETDFAKV